MFCFHAFEYFRKEIPSIQGNYLEIGVFNGDAIAHLALVFPDRTIIGIDPFIEDGNTQHTTGVERGVRILNQRESTMNNIHGKENIKFYEMKSVDFFRLLTYDLANELNVSSILIDGSHWHDDVLIDTTIALKLIGDKKGVVVFDDLRLPDVGKVYDDFVKNPKVSRVEEIARIPEGLAVAAVHLN